MSADVSKVHSSHISSREASMTGWSRVPPESVRADTLRKEVGTEFMAGNYQMWVGQADTLSTSYTTDTTAGNWTYYPIQTWTTGWYDSSGTQPADTISIREIIKEREVTKEVEKRTLFKVYVVDPRKAGKLLDEKTVIAVNENQAMLKADVIKISQSAGLELEQVDVYIQCIGTFVRPAKETQKVKVVKNEEDD